MGKIKTCKKSRIHLKSLGGSLQTSAINDSNEASISSCIPAKDPIIKQASTKSNTADKPDLNNNPFAGINITSDFLQVKLNAGPVKSTSTATAKDDEESYLPRKKDRMKNRREKFLKKLEVAYQSRKPAKKSLKKPHQNKKAVVGDLSFMKLALPEIKEDDEMDGSQPVKPAKLSRRQKRRLKRLNDGNPLQTQKYEKLSNRPTSKQKHKHIVNEIGKFKELMKMQSTLKKGSRDAILENLQKRNLT